MHKILNKLVIVLADDDIDDIQIFEDAIGAVIEYYEFHFFKNGIELINYLSNPQHNQPDILFLDLNMPLMGGFEALRIIREELHLAGMIAMYTTSSQEQHVSRAFSGGANLFVTKPRDFSKLKNLLHKILIGTIEFGGAVPYVRSG
ncbi:response regulator [Flavobacterium sp. NST-5]|uniref:Response regulator n=1 Tax=Flavobacterium ichthyis TaxID=2698827 RepID=A0ABW9Z8K6_9FLAO|nr:response regulator [Flavobacterium ichthyis]NBL63687.1 response regulator [Flavobacterium ichthyis]